LVACSLFLVPGSWFLVPCSWFLVAGSWFLVAGSWFLVAGSLLSRFFLTYDGATARPLYRQGGTISRGDAFILTGKIYPAFHCWRLR
ncbi:MAG TPA: hypothetical protein VNU68_03175, partial [Verrucomicrobiae bacterium]|nr:hypothetical protein [Verrucomicrobiae bacterium]